MKKLSIAILVLAFAMPVMAQKKRTGSETPATTTAPMQVQITPTDTLPMAIYKLALKYGDGAVAANALYTSLAKDPGNVALKDSLATLYFTSRNYFPQSILVAQDILTSQPNNRKMLELVAIAYEGLNRPKEALESYEKVYAISQSVQHLYQIALLQYTLKREVECTASLNSLVANPESEKQVVLMNVENKDPQKIVIKAAALNIAGVLARDDKQYTQARTNFEAALKIAPDFVLAKNNLTALDKETAKK